MWEIQRGVTLAMTTITDMKTPEEIIAMHGENTPGGLDSHKREILRDMIAKGDHEWDQADFIRGFDDGEPEAAHY